MNKRTIMVIAGIVVIIVAFLGAEWAFVPSFGRCVGGGTLKAYVDCSGTFLDRHGTAVTAIATIVIAAFTATLWIVTLRSMDITRESFAANKRAFIFALGLNGFWERDGATGHYNWRFRPLWQNSGDTPSNKGPSKLYRMRGSKFSTSCRLQLQAGRRRHRVHTS